MSWILRESKAVPWRRCVNTNICAELLLITANEMDSARTPPRRLRVQGSPAADLPRCVPEVGRVKSNLNTVIIYGPWPGAFDKGAAL